MMIKRSIPVKLEVLVAERDSRIVEATELSTGSEPRYGEGPHRMITDGLSESLSQTLAKRVEPFELDPAIHRNFNSLRPTEDSFVEFASRFGLLHGGLEVRLEVPGIEINKRPIVSIGEPVESWRAEVGEMQQAIRLWDWTHNRDPERLGEYLSSQGREFPAVIQASFLSGDFFRPAMFLVAEAIDKRLAGETDVCFAENSNPPENLLVLKVKSLRAGLWLMLATEIHDRKKYKPCAQCGKWFEIKTGSRRSTRVYCSNACRTRAHRERQDEARRLYGEGTPINKIAVLLEADSNTIEKWVAGISRVGDQKNQRS